MPSSKNYVRDYQREKETDRARGGIHKRSLRNAARAEMVKAGKAHKGDGKDVDHTIPLAKGGSNSVSNLRVTSIPKNRSFLRNSKGGLVSQTSHKERKK